MPKGNTAPQYDTSYVNGWRRTPWRQAVRMASNGIHQVAVAQQSSVTPRMKGSMDARLDTSPASTTSSAPASVEIAMAPMLIQYDGDRSAGASGRNVQR